MENTIDWAELTRGDHMPTEPGTVACGFEWTPNDGIPAPWGCSRSPHTDGIHIAAARGKILAVCHTTP